MDQPRSVSWLRVGLMTAGVLAFLPATVLFGVVGAIACLGFVLLAALAS